MAEMHVADAGIVHEGDGAKPAQKSKIVAEEEEAIRRFKNMSEEEMDKWIKDYGDERMRQERLDEII